MYIITTSIGFVLKFSSLEDLRMTIEHLDGMANWAEKVMSEGQKVKLAYMISDEAISPEKMQELLDTLPEIEVIAKHNTTANKGD